MEITKEIQGNNIVLKVSGRVDTSNSNQLDEATKDIKEDEFLVLDFQDLEYLSSVGLRILLSLKKRLKDNIKIIEATPMAIPRHVKKDRVLFSRILILAR